MSDINPQNFPGANAVVVGRAGGPYQVKSLPSGTEQAELSVAVGKGYKDRNTGEWVDKGTNWYTLVGTPDYAAENWPQVGPGDTVRIDNARQEVNPYVAKDGEAKADITLRFGTVTLVSRKGEGASASATAGTPF